MRKILIIGKSGSGKTRAAAALASRSRYPTYVVNDSKNKVDEDEKTFPDVDWEELPQLKNANVIVEDIISCTDSQLESLKVLCNYSAHHRKLPLIIMIAHAVTSNNISSLLQNIDQVLFMRNRVTVPSVSFVLSKYQFTKGQRDRLVRDFLLDCKTGPSWLYWVLDAEAGTFRRDSFAGSSAASAPLDTLGEYRKKAQYYVGLFCEHSDKAMAVFEFLLKKIPLQSLNASDLSMSLGGRTDRRVSLIDFLHDVTTFGAVPSGDVVALHRHLLSYADIPSCFYLNPSLKKTKHEKKEPSPPTPVPTTTAVKTHSSSVRAAATVTDDSRSETRIVRKRRDDDNDDRVSSAKRRRVIRY